MGGAQKQAADAAKLVDRADFQLGDARVSPATRRVSGPGGSAMIEQRVMQVLIMLADAGGAVVSREALGERCWGGRIVGDDALNRVIGEIRRVSRCDAAGSFGVETIPRMGYRLTGAVPVPVPGVVPDEPSATPSAVPVSRRAILVGAALGLGGAGLVAAWRLPPDRDEARISALIEQGAQAMRQAMPESDAQGAGFLRQAVALAPDRPDAWGKLALAHEVALDHATPDRAAEVVRTGEHAARRALALDPRQPDALAALARFPPIFGDWLAAERRLRSVLEIDPTNIPALSALNTLLASVGRSREAARISTWIVRREPLSPAHQYRFAYAQWNLNRPGDAERTLDRALELWPRHPALWNTRLLLLALTGRPAMVSAALDDAATRPPGMPPDHAERLRLTMRALESGERSDVAAAVARWRADAPRGPAMAVSAVMFLSALGALGDAYEVARGYLLHRGPLAVKLERTHEQPSIKDQRHRKTMMLFVRPMTRLRADPRFLPLCGEIGLVDYWRTAGVRPDFLDR